MDANSYVDLKPNTKIPDFRPGDAVRVHAKVVEGDRQRIQVFEGVVIRIRRGGVNSSFTVRRVTHGVGVERVFPYYSPLVDKVEVARVGRVRRARLYYLRQRVGKAARIKPGSRARFEALTAKGAVPEPEPEEEYIEEDVIAAEAGIEGEAPTDEGADAVEEAVEDSEPAGEAAEAEAVANDEVPAAAEDETEPQPEAVAEGTPEESVANESAEEAALEDSAEPPSEEPADEEASPEKAEEETPA